jgi:tripartite-type tricarboxylate transporter receptor subunit TctC
MKLPRRKFLRLAAGAAALPAMSRITRAQTYPLRPITMIVPFAAGGQTDVIGRIMAERMRVSLGQPVIVENIGGAGGSIAVGRVVRAAADGYTISIGNWGAYVANGAMYALQYSLLNDVERISLVAESPLLIVSNTAVPAKDLKELIAWLKSNPDKATQGSGGAGTPAHVAGLLFQKETGTQLQHVPYRGTAPAIQDLLAGQINIMIESPAAVLPHLRTGAIKAYAVTAKSRSGAAPDVPSVDEVGMTGFYFSTWNALFAPKGTPNSIVAKLNAAAVEALADSAVRLRLTDLAQELPLRERQTPDALTAFHKAEIEKWWPIIRAANIKGE